METVAPGRCAHLHLDDVAEVGIIVDGTDNPSVDDLLAEQLGHVWLPSVQADVEYATDDLGRLARCDTAEMTRRIDADEAIDLVRRLEVLTGVIAAAQARLAVVVDTHTREAQAELGMPAHQRGAGVPAQLGLARRESPARSAVRLGLAKALTTDLPATMEALAAGETSEYRALLVARATAVLDPDVRRGVDAVIGPELENLSDAAVDAQARALAYRADPHAFTAAADRSAQERYVSIRPAPTVMARLTGCVPAVDGVACWAALDSAARSARASGDARTLAQLRADLFVERLTGRNPATDGPDIEVGIVITDQALLGRVGDACDSRKTSLSTGSETTPRTFSHVSGDPQGARRTTGSEATPEQYLHDPDAGIAGAADEAAYVEGIGPVPTPWARRVLAGLDRDPDSAGEQRVFWRRLFTAPDGTVQTIDTHRRQFSGALRRAIVLRDRRCRTPWCGAPISEVDHVTRSADGGHESWGNGQGLCQACNLAKEAPGWSASAASTGPPGARRHVVTTRTPTGHRYVSHPPAVGPVRRQ